VNPERGLPELLEALRWQWKPTLLVALAFLAGSYLVVRTLPSEYDGKAIVAIAPRADVPSAGADTVRVVAPKYVDYVTAPATVRAVAIGLPDSAQTLEKAVNATLARDTGTITVTVRLRSPERAAQAANAFAQQLVNFSRGDPLLSGQLVAEALPPKATAAPPRRLLLGAALIVGLLLGAGVSVLRERGRPRLRTWRDMARLTGYQVVGRIPTSRTLRKKMTMAFSDPIVGASFRTLRANIEPQLRDHKIKLIVVTSASPADGKTTVAALVAEALSRLGARTLLVDGDLRRPRLATMMSLNEHRGLSSVLRRGSELKSEVQPGWVQDLFVLPTVVDDDAGDLLARRFGEVADEALEDFEFIVVDTPPLLATEDARTIATHAQAVLLVVSAGSSVEQVNEAILTIESLKAPLLGLVGNRLKESGAAYYYGSGSTT